MRLIDSLPARQRFALSLYIAPLPPGSIVDLAHLCTTKVQQSSGDAPFLFPPSKEV